MKSSLVRRSALTTAALAIALGIVAGSALPSEASPPPLPSGQGLYTIGCDGTLYSVNPASGASTPIGSGDSTGPTGCADQAAFDPANQTAYYISGHTNGPVYSIDLGTGHSTEAFQPIDPDTDAPATLANLTFGPTGIAYTNYGANLDSVSLQTGQLTPIGSTGLGDITVNSLAWDPAENKLIGVASYTGELYEIDPTTGLATALFAFPNSVPGDVTALAIDEADHLWFLLDFDGIESEVELWSFAPQFQASGPLSDSSLGGQSYSSAALFVGTAPAAVTPAPPAIGTSPESTPRLPTTGLDIDPAVIPGSLAALLAGALLIILGRRRRRAEGRTPQLASSQKGQR